MLHCVYAFVCVCARSCACTHTGINKIQILKSLALSNICYVVHSHSFKNIFHFIFRKCDALFSKKVYPVLENENLLLCVTLLALFDEVWYLFQADTS